MSDSRELTDMAARVQAAYDVSGPDGQAYIIELMADTLDIRHEPPAPLDGPEVPRSVLVETQEKGWAALDAALTELRLEGKVTVENERLVVTKTFTGIGPDGKEVKVVSRADYIVDGGKIVGADSTGSKAGQTLMDAADS